MAHRKGHVSRGVRNNNPGNIRHSNDAWHGAREKQTDPEFVQFIEPKWGLRATARNLITYSRRKARDGSPVDTLAEVITRWAPPFENNTAAYIAFVAKATGFKPDDVIDLKDRETLRLMTAAIVKKETSAVFTPDEIREAVDLSFLNAN